MGLIKQFGLHWPRNIGNLEEIQGVAGHKSGIYVLYHGAMPVYIRRGAISARLLSHAKEGSKNEEFWDRFSWFVVGNSKQESELEPLQLEALPFYVRSLNQQMGKLSYKMQVVAPDGEVMNVALPRLAPGSCGRRVTSAVHQHCREKGGAFRHGLCNDVFAG
jgi:hypothetical protein